MRLVLDTNTIVSGALWRGSPYLLLAAATASRFTPCTCNEILRELLDVLSRPKFSTRMIQSNSSPLRIVREYQRLALMISLPPIIPRVCRDPKDDVILACATQAQAAAIVSGDKDLLSLKQYQNIPILTPAQVLNSLP
jgi:putative PIN family toxin of toxin-antitoxin system